MCITVHIYIYTKRNYCLRSIIASRNFTKLRIFELAFQLDGSRLTRFANKPGSLPRGARSTQACASLLIGPVESIIIKEKPPRYQFPFPQRRRKEPVVIKERRRDRNRSRLRFVFANPICETRTNVERHGWRGSVDGTGRPA